MADILVLQHESFEGLGVIGDVLDAAGIGYRHVQGFAGEPVPREIGDFPALIVMGGHMGVYEQEQYPFLRDEIKLIESALGQGKPVLGVCLGSQLIAAALGARVAPARSKEIGWFDVRLKPDAATASLVSGIPASFRAFHWHGDIFDLPAGAVSLARSQMTEHQAFSYGDNVYGFLFHPEATAEIVRGMVDAGQDELKEIGASGKDIVRESVALLSDSQQIGQIVAGEWIRLLLGSDNRASAQNQ